MAEAANLTFSAYVLQGGNALNAVKVTAATHIRTRRGRHEVANPGDYIVLDPDGSMRVVREATFEAEMVAQNAPSAPTSLATSAQTASQITLTWTDAATQDSVNVYRDGVLIANVDDAVETYDDDDAALTPNTSYSYRLRSVLNEALSVLTSAITAWTDPAPPTNCAVLITGATTATVTWDDVPGDADVQYQVYVDGSPSGTPAAAGVETKDITGLTTATEYDFTVRAVGLTSTQASADSNTATDTTQ